VPLPPPALCVADDATFWPWFTSPGLGSWPDPARTVVVLPLAGFADWGLGHALDAEETVLLAVLRAASGRRPKGLALLVVPPLRFVFGPEAGCAFAVRPPVIHALIAEVVASVAAAGFKRVVLYNSSPWNEEVCAAAARDLRLRHDLQLFRLNLAALGLDFHPRRSPDRRRVQTLVTALTGRVPDPPPAAAEPIVTIPGDESVRPLSGPPATAAEAAEAGPPILAAAADQLLALLAEIQARPAPAAQFTS
jgi:creatinine amidohydrolase